MAFISSRPTIYTAIRLSKAVSRCLAALLTVLHDKRKLVLADDTLYRCNISLVHRTDHVADRGFRTSLAAGATAPVSQHGLTSEDALVWISIQHLSLNMGLS